MNVHVFVGASLTNLQAIQDGFTSVLVNWTESTNPVGVYQIVTIPSTSTIISLRPPQNLELPTPGVYTIRLLFNSEEFPSVEIAGVRMQGEDN